MNVKTTTKGTGKRNKIADPLTNENLDKFTEFFSKFESWVKDWQTSKENGLTPEIFRTLTQTSRVFPLLVKYLLQEKGLKYVLTGKCQSNPLERRFGRWRQSSGGNYFATERQFLEAERAIGVKLLIKLSNYSMKEVCQIMQEEGDENTVEEYAEHVVDLLSEEVTDEILNTDKNIVFYVAGFIARSLKKKCEKCVNIIGGDEETGLDIDGLDEGNASFVNSINRGGLIKPGNILYISCIISWTIYKEMMDNEEAK